MPIFAGYFGSPVPYKMPLFVAIGEPIVVPQCPEDKLDKKSGMPPREMATPFLKQYAAALETLFETHKAQAGYPASRKLLIEADFSVKEQDSGQVDEAFVKTKGGKKED